MTKLNEELNEVQNIMTKNIQEVLGQGEKLESTFEPKEKKQFPPSSSSSLSRITLASL